MKVMTATIPGQLAAGATLLDDIDRLNALMRKSCTVPRPTVLSDIMTVPTRISIALRANDKVVRIACPPGYNADKRHHAAHRRTQKYAKDYNEIYSGVEPLSADYENCHDGDVYISVINARACRRTGTLVDANELKPNKTDERNNDQASMTTAPGSLRYAAKCYDYRNDHDRRNMLDQAGAHDFIRTFRQQSLLK